MNFLLFGTGDYYARYKKWFSKESVLALLDNSPEKQNTCIDGIPVVAPEQGIVFPYDAIVILSFYVKAMKKQLMDLEVPEEKIYHFYDLHKLLSCREFQWPVQYYGQAKYIINRADASQKKILLLSHDLTLGGPALALYHGARVLVKQEFSVVFASMIDGPLKERLLAEQIPVVVDYNLQIGTMEEIGWAKGFSLMICNTINYHVFLSKRDPSIPVLWWLHDSEFFYDGVERDLLSGLECGNMKIAAVGPVPRKVIKRFLPDIGVQNLLYGVADNMCSHPPSRNFLGEKQSGGRESISNKDTEGSAGLPVCFVTIGYVEARKGQDLLIEVVKLLPEEVRRKAVFYLVGQDTSMMALQIKAEIQKLPQVIMTGTIGSEGIAEMLNQADVLICPSREDPMPTVAAEAMMNWVPCIMSDEAGTSDYIKDGVDGLIFRSEDVKDLAGKIAWAIHHREEVNNMGARARRIYENWFSMEVFEKNFLECLDSLVE